MISNFSKRILPAFLIAFSLAACAGVPAKPHADAGAGIIYGPSHAFTLRAPDSWVLDNKSGVKNGLDAVFYPTGSSWETSDAIMYGKGFAKGSAGRELADFIAADQKKFRKDDPNMEILRADDLKTGNGKRATVFEFHSKDRHEAVAYVDEKNSTITLVLSARSLQAFVLSRPAFSQLVGGYHSLTDDVTVEDKQGKRKL